MINRNQGDVSMQDSIIRKPTVRQKSGLAQSTIDRLEAEGKFPKRRRITQKTVGWSESEVNEWVKERLSGKPA